MQDIELSPEERKKAIWLAVCFGLVATAFGFVFLGFALTPAYAASQVLFAVLTTILLAFGGLSLVCAAFWYWADKKTPKESESAGTACQHGASTAVRRGSTTDPAAEKKKTMMLTMGFALLSVIAGLGFTIAAVSLPQGDAQLVTAVLAVVFYSLGGVTFLGYFCYQNMQEEAARQKRLERGSRLP